MARCFVTGVQISLDDSWALDVSEVHRAVRELKSQLTALEGLLAQLGDRDEIHLKDHVTGRERTRRDCRLVCASVAEALGGVCPGRPLFVTFQDWKKLRDQRRAWLKGKGGIKGGATVDMPVEGADSAAGSCPDALTGPKEDLVADGRGPDGVTPEGVDCHGKDRIWDAGDFR